MIIPCKKIPIFDRILNNLYLGDIEAAKDLSLLKQNKIEVIISLISDEYEKDENITYYNFPVEDDRNVDIQSLFKETNSIIKNNKDKNILIHCYNGVSRSVTILLAYLISEGQKLSDTFTLIKNKRSQYSKPNIGFCRQLIKYERENLGYNSVDLSEFIDLTKQN